MIRGVGIPLKWNAKKASGQPYRWNQGLAWNGNLPAERNTVMSEMYQFSATFDPLLKASTITGIRTAKDAIPFLLATTAKENKDAFSLGPEWLPYTQEFISRGTGKPTLLPSHVDMVEVQKSMTIYNDMNDVENALTDFLGRIKATKIKAGSQVLASAIDTQKHLEIQAKRNVADAREFFESLKTLSAAKHAPKPTTPTTDPTP